MTTAPRTNRPNGGFKRELARWFVAPDFYREREVTVGNWVEGVFEPFAVVTTIACFIIGFVAFFQALAPMWVSQFVVPLAIVVSLEAFFYARRLARASLIVKEWAALLVPPLIVLRFGPYLLEPERLGPDLARWWSEPLSFFSAGFIVGGLLLLFAWWASYATTHDLNRIRVQAGELPSGDRLLSRYGLDDAATRLSDHTTPLRAIAQRFLWGGAILVWLGGLTAVGVQQRLSFDVALQLVTFSRASEHLVLANIVLYFVCGFLLIGEAQYVRLNTLWRLERLTVPPQLATRWALWLVALVVMAMAIAFVLPTEWAASLTVLISGLLFVLAQIMMLLGALVALLLTILLWPLRLLSSSGNGEQASRAMPPAMPAPPPGDPIPWLEFAKSALFWLVVLGLTIYLLSILWRRRPPLPRWVPGRGWLIRLADWLGEFARSLLRLSRQAAAAIATALPALFGQVAGPVANRPRNWLSLRALGPRDLIAYFYLSVVERAARLGHPRQPGQTALEYSRTLRDRLPDVDPELEALTDAFLEARYGPRPVTTHEVRQARTRWETLRSKLRRLRLRRVRDGPW